MQVAFLLGRGAVPAAASLLSGLGGELEDPGLDPLISVQRADPTNSARHPWRVLSRQRSPTSLSWVGTALSYKLNAEDELERRKQLGISGPEIIPHPDDIESI
jgi:hypothetical protein